MENKSLKGMPDKVLFFKLQPMCGLEQYEKILKEYPEWFPDEVEYRKKWDLVPELVKDSYFKSVYSDLFAKTHPEIGDIPYPELSGLGIIRTAEIWSRGDKEELRKLDENDKWRKKLFNIQEKEEIEQFNKHFNQYGLKK